MASSIQFQKGERPDLAKHDSSVLDLAFAMDCTGKHDKMSDLIYVLLGS
jgi:hypothetical protein